MVVVGGRVGRWLWLSRLFAGCALKRNCAAEDCLVVAAPTCTLCCWLHFGSPQLQLGHPDLCCLQGCMAAAYAATVEMLCVSENCMLCRPGGPRLPAVGCPVGARLPAVLSWWSTQGCQLCRGFGLMHSGEMHAKQIQMVGDYHVQDGC